MKLYEITETMLETLDIFLESEREEIDQEFYTETMEYLKVELSSKSSNIIKYLINLDSEVFVIKSEIERLTKIKKARERKSSSLRAYLVNTMKTLEKTKIETDLGSYGIRKSMSLEVYDVNKIPEKYLKIKQELSVNKREVTNQIKAGEEVTGAKLIERYSLQIK